METKEHLGCVNCYEKSVVEYTRTKQGLGTMIHIMPCDNCGFQHQPAHTSKMRLIQDTIQP